MLLNYHAIECITFAMGILTTPAQNDGLIRFAQACREAAAAALERWHAWGARPGHHAHTPAAVGGRLLDAYGCGF